MIILKSFIICALFITANSNAILSENQIIFPDQDETKLEATTSTERSSEITIIIESSTETTTTTDSSTEITTSTDNSSETTTASDNLKENQTETNNEPFCGDQTGGDYCAYLPGYPEENILKAVVSQQGILRSFFEEKLNITELSLLTPNPQYDYDYDYDYKQEEEFENVCRAETDHIMPRAAKNTKGEFMFIVNQPKGNDSFIQKVQVGKCVNPGNECGGGAVFDAKTECHQEFLEHKLVSISKDGYHVVVDTFRFPSCCTCRIIKDIF